MFCPKCGQQNPETGKFCRSCGTGLGNVSQALAGSPSLRVELTDHKGRPVSWDRAIPKLFTGIAFIVVAIALAFSRMGQGWWFWMLIPAFSCLGAGVAQMIQLRNAEKHSGNRFSSPIEIPMGPQGASLPPQRAEWINPESRYKTGDLVPNSVTEGTTRHLDLDKEGHTMTLPKND